MLQVRSTRLRSNTTMTTKKMLDGVTVKQILPSSIMKGSYKKRRVGLLGGSFNPAHTGHRMITNFALKRLRLNSIWWLVSTQNPLKSTKGMEPLSKRLSTARLTATHPRVVVKPIEFQLNTRYTADTIALLKKRYTQTRFVWIMGADNLAQFSEWKDWQRISRMVNIAVFNRPGYSQKALSGKMARRFANSRIRERKSILLGKLKPPKWVFLHTLLNPISATSIRETKLDNNNTRQ